MSPRRKPLDVKPLDFRTKVFRALARSLRVSEVEALRLVTLLASVIDVEVVGQGFYVNPHVRRLPSGKVLRKSGWWKAQLPSGQDARLRLTDIANHLLSVAVAVPRRSSVRALVIDVDAKDEAQKKTLAERVRLVRRCFNDAACCVLRSSKSGGVHVMYFLMSRVDADTLNARATRRLTQAGAELGREHLEVFPHANRQLRLPLGPGATILQGETLLPAFGSTDKRGVFKRDTRGALLAFLAFARDNRLTMRELFSGNPATESWPHGREGFTNTQGERGRVPVPQALDRRNAFSWAPERPPLIPLPSKFHEESEFQKTIIENAYGIAYRGTRHRVSNSIVFYLIVQLGLEEDTALSFYEKWLTEGDHDSKTLFVEGEERIRKMLVDARTYARKLGKRIADRMLTVGSNRDGYGALRAYLETARALLEGEWRRDVLSYLTAADRELLADRVEDRWLRVRMELVVAVLRCGFDVHGEEELVSIKSTVMQTILGGKPPPSRLLRRVGGKTYGTTRRRLVMDTLQRIGLLSFEDSYNRGVNATIYRVALP